jgi:hyperosmotically inducible protein
MKKTMISAIFLLAVSLLPGTLAIGGNRQQNPQQQPAPDNTKTNQRDRDSSSPTADQQKMNPADREITKKIRAAIHQDKSISTYAHNIKVITQGGKVTLKGPVHSDEEKSSIASKAVEIAGEGNVTNELDVVPSRQ